MRRDLRRFLAIGWTLVDAPARVSVNLASMYGYEFGYLPPAYARLVRGYHFRGPRSRSVWIADGAVDPADTARVCALIGSKYAVGAQLAIESALPSLPPVEPPSRLSAEYVEFWPPHDREVADSIVLECGEGLYVSCTRDQGGGWWAPATPDPRVALTFESVEDAEAWQAFHAEGELLRPRYRCAAIAEADIYSAETRGPW